jgi:HAD superfamily hydrolase (TIGR01509 family)
MRGARDEERGERRDPHREPRLPHVPSTMHAPRDRCYPVDAATAAASRDGVLHPRALVFDMDGLMVDSEPLWFEVERDFARARGGDWTEDVARACVGRGLANTLRTMRAAFPFDLDVARDSEDIVQRFIDRVGELELKRGCRALIDEARAHVPVAVGSSSARRLVHAVLDRFALRPCFGAVVTGDDVAHPKPAPDIFLRAAELVRVAPRDCVVLEDSVAGVASARAAGMHVIAVPEAESERFGEADFVVRDLVEARARLDFNPARPAC